MQMRAGDVLSTLVLSLLATCGLYNVFCIDKGSFSCPRIRFYDKKTDKKTAIILRPNL